MAANNWVAIYMFRKRLTILGFLLVSSATIAMEDDDLIALYDEEELISIATGTEKQIRFAPSVATVITSEDIKRIGARTLDEALESVPGLHVSRSFNRQDAIYSFRGIHTGQNPQVLLLIDGVRLQQLFSGARPYNFDMSTANIERIEIIRGPGSALYGADAFAGVISVTTKSAHGINGTTVGGRAGSFDTQEGWLSTHEEWGEIKVDLSLEYKSTGGDRDRVVKNDFQTSLLAGTPTEPTFAPGPLEMGAEYWSGRARFSAGHWFANLYTWNLVNAGVGSGGAQALDPVGHDEGYLHGIDFGFQDISLAEDIAFSTNVNVQALEIDAEFQLLPPGSTFAGFVFPVGVLGNPSIQEDSYSLSSVIDISSIDEHDIRVGVGLNRIELDAEETKNFSAGNFISLDFVSLQDVTGTDQVFIKDGHREHYYVYVQDEWSVANDWQATIGVRYDSYNQFGDSINPRAALVWATRHNLTTKLLYGRAFRAPSFSELFAENNPALLGNSELEPETIDTFEIAFDYSYSQNLQMAINLFHYRIKDLVEVPFNSEAINSVKQKGTGFEYEIEWAVSDQFDLIANYALHDAENRQTGRDIANAPRKQLYVSGQWTINENRSLSVTANWVADRKRIEGDLRKEIDDYVLVDLVFNSATALENLDLSLIAKNIFNEDAREPSTPGIVPAVPEIPDDYPEEGQSITLELTYSLD